MEIGVMVAQLLEYFAYFSPSLRGYLLDFRQTLAGCLAWKKKKILCMELESCPDRDALQAPANNSETFSVLKKINHSHATGFR